MTEKLGDYQMDEQECWERLGSHATMVGRLGYLEDGIPAILPVNYRVDGRSIVFRTGPGSKLSAAVSAQVLAFEVDEVDAGWQTGWSVLVRGRGTRIADSEEIRRLTNIGLRPWSAGEKDHWVRLRGTRISGRHLT